MKWIGLVQNFITFIKDNINNHNEINQNDLKTLMDNITTEISEMKVENKLVETVYCLNVDIYNHFFSDSGENSDDTSSDSESQSKNQSDNENQLSCSVDDWIIKIKTIEIETFRLYMWQK